MVFIFLVILLLFGAKRLPELARGLGQAVSEFNKAKDDVQRQITRADEPVVQRPAQSVAQNAAPATPATPAAPIEEQPKQAQA